MKPKRNHREEKFFTVAKVFPPSDRLGMQILCLMAAYNDISRLVDCMMAEPTNQTDELAQKISSGRRAMYIRLTMGLLHEALQFINKNEDWGKGDLEESLNLDGIRALASLRFEKHRLEKSVFKLMDKVRNKATFHYLPHEFAAGIKMLKKGRGEDIEASFIYEDYPDGRGRIYYLLADHVRDASGFGLVSPEQADAIVRDVRNVMGLLFDFTHNALGAYLENRHLTGEFRPHRNT